MVRGLATIVLGSIALLAAAAGASSFQLDLTVNEEARTFDVWGSVSTDDNAGMASFSLDLVNIATARVVAPMAFDQVELRLKGFVTNSPALVGDGVVYGYQNFSDPDSLLVGIGQMEGSFPVYPGSYAVGVPWTAPAKLVTGTYSGPALPAIGPAATVDVFRHVSSTELETASVYLPEPACALLLLLGGLWWKRKR